MRRIFCVAMTAARFPCLRNPAPSARQLVLLMMLLWFANTAGPLCLGW